MVKQGSWQHYTSFIWTYSPRLHLEGSERERREGVRSADVRLLLQCAQNKK